MYKNAFIINNQMVKFFVRSEGKLLESASSTLKGWKVRGKMQVRGCF